MRFRLLSTVTLLVALTTGSLPVSPTVTDADEPLPAGFERREGPRR
ncbi:MAG: hypothetical protein IT179_15960 [Acidobacteria bacterium]|nr:hypothetical protein [Acidobacteriota bacterium]